MSSSLAAVAENLVTDTWVKASWEEFLKLAENPDYVNARFYYHQAYMRIETMSLGASHGQDNAILSKVVSLFATIKNIRIKELANTSFRKAGIAECQPDLAFYIGADFQFPPRNNSPIDLNELAPPNLVVEIASTTLSDDLGRKRLLYERLGVQEYWVVDVSVDDVIAFEISQRRSGEIEESRVLPGLAIALVEEALQRSQTQDDGEINRWLIQTFSQS
ncbi:MULTISPECIES: Uma2 family endonuclease [Aerosakkonema]|uniref:Uma2 family endonuclease n=1 Tax=Aerosakkonema TaxID=1246629 RepID=UPI0035BACBBA